MSASFTVSLDRLHELGQLVCKQTYEMIIAQTGMPRGIAMGCALAASDEFVGSLKREFERRGGVVTDGS